MRRYVGGAISQGAFKMVSVRPAYGRDYAKKEEVLRDWDAGLDFAIIGVGAYLNKEDAPKGESIQVYYRQGRVSTIIKN
jgi:hypothetical protein